MEYYTELREILYNSPFWNSVEFRRIEFHSRREVKKFRRNSVDTLVPRLQTTGEFYVMT